MLSSGCKTVVKAELKKLGLHFIIVELGEVEITENISDEMREKLRVNLFESGFELMDDKKALPVPKLIGIAPQLIFRNMVRKVLK